MLSTNYFKIRHCLLLCEHLRAGFYRLVSVQNAGKNEPLEHRSLCSEYKRMLSILSRKCSAAEDTGASLYDI